MNLVLEIISIGNELLIGKISNNNARWIAKRATTLGLEVRRIVTVKDDVDEISSAVQEAIQRHPRFIVTTGGLGPTFDDKSLEGVAKGTGRKLEINHQALRQIDETFQKLLENRRSEFSDEDIKRFEQIIANHARGDFSPSSRIAKIPEGSRIVVNADTKTGGGMGVLMELEGTTLISLPGVPQQVRIIFEKSIVPLLRQASGNMMFFETRLDVKEMWEGQIAPLIDQVMLENPQVYIKSFFHLAKNAGKYPNIELQLSTFDKDLNTAKNRLNKALIQISKLIQNKGGKTSPTKTKS
jgi:molybdenum cofactor synthesis domain-containing protein